jgi:hypothetical protein
MEAEQGPLRRAHFLPVQRDHVAAGKGAGDCLRFLVETGETRRIIG